MAIVNLTITPGKEACRASIEKLREGLSVTQAYTALRLANASSYNGLPYGEAVLFPWGPYGWILPPPQVGVEPAKPVRNWKAKMRDWKNAHRTPK